MKSRHVFVAVMSGFIISACNFSNDDSLAVKVSEINLKKGEPIFCGPADQKLGLLSFVISGSEEAKKNFVLGLKLLHSFEYDEAEKVFASIINKDPSCVMAYWGVAMSNFHPLWAPPSEAELQKGLKSLEIAKSISGKSDKESDYLDAISAFYIGWDKADHKTRCLRFEKAMEKLYTVYGGDTESAVLYSLALNAAADPSDKSFSKQKKAGRILDSLYARQPDHPGIVHYIIHTYDSPELARMALPAARQYAAIAPSSAHALHMPSHIFTRLGLWDDCISSNLASVSSAQCYAEQAGIKGHWDEELHGIDYLVYAHLQKGENMLARKQVEYLEKMSQVSPVNFKVAYAFAAIPSRYVLENKLWKEAQRLQVSDKVVDWNKYPWQKAIIHFTNILGSVHMKDVASAELQLQDLKSLHDTLIIQKDTYKATQVAIQVKSSEAWLQFIKGNHNEAVRLMNTAADLEDKSEKHPVTPGEVIPARELLGDMYMELQMYTAALNAYERSLKKSPNRFNALYGAGRAAEKAGIDESARAYYTQLLKIAERTNHVRPELRNARQYVEKVGRTARL